MTDQKYREWIGNLNAEKFWQEEKNLNYVLNSKCGEEAKKIATKKLEILKELRKWK